MTPDVNLNGFLQFGFFPDYADESHFDISTASPGAYGNTEDEELFTRLNDVLHEAMADLLADKKEPLLLISGGLDSRLIFALLLEYVEAKDLRTCTFGTPGSYDFEIGTSLARRAGTENHVYDLTRHEYTEEELLRLSTMFRRQTVMFHHMPWLDFKARFSDLAIWSGFLAGEAAKGCDKPASELEAFRGFFNKNRYSRTENVCRLDDETLAAALVIPESERTLLLLEDELNFRHRQAKFIAPHVIPLGFEHRTIFAHPKVLTFFLGLTHAQRRKASFYERFLVARYPKWFGTATKNKFGLPLDASPGQVRTRRIVRGMRRRAVRFGLPYVDRMTNYLDFAEQLRGEGSAFRIVRSAVEDLQARRIVDWVDGPDLLRRHRLGQAHGAEALLLLTSLEIHLKNGKTLDAGH